MQLTTTVTFTVFALTCLSSCFGQPDTCQAFFREYLPQTAYTVEVCKKEQQFKVEDIKDLAHALPDHEFGIGPFYVCIGLGCFTKQMTSWSRLRVTQQRLAGLQGQFPLQSVCWTLWCTFDFLDVEAFDDCSGVDRFLCLRTIFFSRVFFNPSSPLDDLTGAADNFSAANAGSVGLIFITVVF